MPWTAATLLLCLLALHHGRLFARASDWEENGQRNILQGLSKGFPLGNAALRPTPAPDEAESATLEAFDSEVPEKEEDCWGEVSPEAPARVAHGLMQLGAGLLREMEREQPRGNLFFSPFSIGVALAQLALGAANETERLLLEALHAEPVPCFYQALRDVSQHLAGSALSLAARIYLEKGFPVKAAFLRDSERLFGAKPATLSGDDEADLRAINGWVEEATGGQIPEMLSELPADAVMVLLNAIHFRGLWKTRFDPQLTEPSPFYLEEGAWAWVPTMKAQAYPLRWFALEALDVQVARFPFEGNASLVAVLPNHFEGNFSRLLSALGLARLHGPFPPERPTVVQMPRLALRERADLKETLGRLGLGQLFSSPSLPGIAEGPLRVSAVQHQAALDLSESGLEASAATGVTLSRSLSAFHLNRPFLFAVLDDRLGLPLFLGCVRDPEPGAARESRVGGRCGDKESFCGTDDTKP